MANQPWLDEVQRRLAESNLPAAYIRRFMDELTDHFQDLTHDLTEETMSTETSVASRLGEANQVADAAVLAFQQRTFFGRHPSAKFWVFGVSPILSLFALLFLTVECMTAVFSIYEKLGFDLHIKRFDPLASQMLPYLISLVMVVIPSVLAGTCYCCLAKKLGIGRIWMFVSCFLLAVIAMAPVWSIKLSDIPGQSAIRCGLPMPSSIADLVGTVSHDLRQPRQAMQSLAPLLVGAWFAFRAKKPREDQDDRLPLAA